MRCACSGVCACECGDIRHTHTSQRHRPMPRCRRRELSPRASGKHTVTCTPLLLLLLLKIDPSRLAANYARGCGRLACDVLSGCVVPCCVRDLGVSDDVMYFEYKLM